MFTILKRKRVIESFELAFLYAGRFSSGARSMSMTGPPRTSSTASVSGLPTDRFGRQCILGATPGPRPGVRFIDSHAPGQRDQDTGLWAKSCPKTALATDQPIAALADRISRAAACSGQDTLVIWGERGLVARPVLQSVNCREQNNKGFKDVDGRAAASKGGPFDKHTRRIRLPGRRQTGPQSTTGTPPCCIVGFDHAENQRLQGGCISTD